MMAQRESQFIDRVYRMRLAQKRYFATRQLCYLIEAKELERLVDVMLDGYFKKSEAENGSAGKNGNSGNTCGNNG